MRRLTIPKADSLTIEEVEHPEPGSGELVLQIAYAGICGSDIHAYKGEHPFIPLPVSPGHEFSGIVSAVGPGGSTFSPGDRVTCEPNLACGTCYNCLIGRYNICEDLKVMGCQTDGAHADYYVVPEEKTIPLPSTLSLRHGALIEPLAVGVHAVREAGDLFGKHVLITGAGMIGLSILVSVVRSGAKRIWVTDASPMRLSVAGNLGANKTIDVSQEDASAIIQQERPFEGIDVVFEAVGIGATVQQAIELVRKGGKIVVAGVFSEDIPIKMSWIQDREIELKGTLMYTRRDFIDAADILANNPSLGDTFITSMYPLEQAHKAFEAAQDRENNIKVLLEINP